MSALAERIAREHPNYIMSREYDTKCKTCGAPIEVINGRVDLGWNRHVAEVTEAAVVSAYPTREEIARFLYEYELPYNFDDALGAEQMLWIREADAALALFPPRALT